MYREYLAAGLCPFYEGLRVLESFVPAKASAGHAPHEGLASGRQERPDVAGTGQDVLA
jgi:hypothetical protein